MNRRFGFILAGVTLLCLVGLSLPFMASASDVDVSPLLLDSQSKAPAAQDGATISWIDIYKHPQPQPLCTGVGVRSYYFGGEECGFGVMTLSPSQSDADVHVRFMDEQGTTFHTETATYDSSNDEYQVTITPESDWSPGRVTLKANTDGGDNARTQLYLNWLAITANLDQSSYAPGDSVVVSGTVAQRSGTGTTPTTNPVAADLTLELRDPDNSTMLTSTTTTAAGDGTWSATFAGSATAGFDTNEYTLYIRATWQDSTATFGPSEWEGDLTRVIPFDIGGSSVHFTARQTANNGTVHAGDTLLYVLTTENPTDVQVSNVQVTATLPTGVDLSGATVPAPDGGTGTAGNPLRWDLGTLDAGAEERIYLYTDVKTQAEERTIVWQVLDVTAGFSYVNGGTSEGSSDATLGPKVVPIGDVGDSVRHGRRPFPVALVDYRDVTHDSSNTGDYFEDQIFATLIDRYLEMSFGQLLPVPVLPSVGRGAVPYESNQTFSWSTLDPNGFCSGTTTAGESGNPGDPDGPPAGATDRIVDDWYQLPGTQGYYGSDSSGSAYAGALTGVPTLMNVDNGCNPPGAIVYDAATMMDPDVDYNRFDSDRDGWVDFFELVYAGQPENVLGQTGVNNIWPHSSSLAYYYTDGYVSQDQLRNHQNQPLFWTNSSKEAMTTTDTGIPVYVKVGPYNVNAEFSGETTFSHEYGHSLGMPDNYSLGSRNTMGDWDLMASGEGHMSIWDKQELGWIVPFELSSDTSLPQQSAVKTDIGRIEWRDDGGQPYTLTENVHNAEVYKRDLPSVQLFDPGIIPSGDWVYYSQAGNDFGYPGHIFDISFDGNLTDGADSVTLRFRSWFEIETDWDYGYVQVSTDGGETWTNLPSEQGTTTSTNPNGNNQGNGITCISGAQDGTFCSTGVGTRPAPTFITDTFDVSAYAGQDFILRWAYSTDAGVAWNGWVVDDVELLADGERVFFDDAEDASVSTDDAHVYNGWVRSNGSGTAEHAYWMGVRDKTKFDAATSFEPGVVIEYANESHGYGNFGVDNPPALTVVDSRPQPGNDQPNLNDAGWRPNPDDRFNTGAENRDIFTDCDDPDYANGPRHIDNYGDPDTSDGNWHFGWQSLRALVYGIGGEGTGSMTANVAYEVDQPCPDTPAPPPEPTLNVSKQTNTGHVTAGDAFTYTLKVENTGEVALTDVVVTDTLPAPVSYEGCSGGASCSLSDGVVTWRVGLLSPGSKADLTLVVRVDTDVAGGSTVVNDDYGADSNEVGPVNGEPVETPVWHRMNMPLIFKEN